jgi:CRP-like cAMP-binding protein
VGFSRAARSVISLQKRQSQITEHDDEDANERDEVRGATQTEQPDSWASVLSKVAKKTGATDRVQTPTASAATAAATSATTSGDESHAQVSLAHMLRSREVKNFVKQSVVTSRWNKQVLQSSSALSPLHESGQSTVMEHWVKTTMLRNQADVKEAGLGSDEDDDEDTLAGIESGFDVRASKTRHMYGRTLLLEESCRRAFAQSSENRSQMDLQALKAWFQMTKLKITTDFERLQPAELDLLCRRMTLVSFHPKEIVFRQGDEGDALYLVFSGCVEVRVSQQILGEKVEVTVCELSKGDYFGERSLLNNDVRAATVTAKVTTDLVRISRKDYNIMLKKDQMEFLSRMQMTNGLVIPKSAQQSQREYIRVLTKKKNTRTKTDIDMLSEYLQTLKFFRALPKTFVRELCTVVDFLKLPAGTCVFKEGEVGDLFYIIFTGSVDVIVSSKDFRGNAQQTKLINLTEGSHFGELALMKGHGIRSATVMTREECRFLIICERDYNATLRRMQKEDLAKRVGVLDKISIFQTPEWTGELLKEMSYVLSEQKLPASSVLFKQGDKALQVFFVVRGELVMTKEIVNPVTHVTQLAVVERVGRYRVVGDDAYVGQFGVRLRVHFPPKHTNQSRLCLCA